MYGVAVAGRTNGRTDGRTRAREQDRKGLEEQAEEMVAAGTREAERWRTRARGGREGEGRWVANDEHGEIQLRSTYVSFRG